MATPDRELKNERLYLRVSPRQREVINEAADAAGRDVSAFVLDAALIQAESVLADRRLFKLDEAKWAEFVRVLDRSVTPLVKKPRLERLLREPSVAER